MSWRTGETKQKTGGRAKGTPNKRTLDFESRIQELGLDPLENLCKLLPHLPDAQQAKIYITLLDYVYPRRKSVEAPSNLDDPRQENLEVTPERISHLRAMILDTSN